MSTNIRRIASAAVLTTLLAFTTPAFAHSFLGTIRGTIVDPQGQVVSAAAVIITDEATGAVRTLETDAEGRYDAPNLRPGTYRVEVVTTNFKKFERTGVLLRAAGTAQADRREQSLSHTQETSCPSISIPCM